MKIKCLYGLFILLAWHTGYSQSISVFDVDASDFPTIKAKIFAFDASGNQITNFNISDLEVFENGSPRNITKLTCPDPQIALEVSSVLTIDISSSMAEANGMEIAQSAARVWVNSLPVGISECAVTSFDDMNYLNHDFTSSSSKLLTAINSLTPKGGTDYEAGLINPTAGSLVVSKNGRYNKVVVFLTDGEPNKEPDVEKIVAEAVKQNCKIYAIVVGIDCPQSLQDISLRSGGMWFGNIKTEKEAEAIYRMILQTSLGGEPCEIEWLSQVSCKIDLIDLNVKSIINDSETHLRYKAPDIASAKLVFNPPTVKFENPNPGETVEKTINITAKNAYFYVSEVKSSNPAYYITPKSFSLAIGQTIPLTVKYLPMDSGYTYCNFTFDDICLSNYHVSGGWKGIKPTFRTLKLLHPDGGEVFVAGTDTTITWEGVPPDQPVRIEYRSADNRPWVKIADSAVGLSYKFKIPTIVSDKYLARIAVDASSDFIDNDMVLIPADTFIMGNTGLYPAKLNEYPTHNVIISRDFLMSKYEITQRQYEAVIGVNPSNHKGDYLPVERVTWFDAIEYCNKRSDLEGLTRCYSGSDSTIVCDFSASGYRLPTEAEWEYACRGGSTTDFYNGDLYHYACSPLDQNLEKIGWYCGNQDVDTHEVGLKKPNSFGLHDMSGNVWEWCWDWYGFYIGADETDPIGPASGISRILKGGSWGQPAYNCRASARFDLGIPDNRLTDAGFRIVRNY